MVKKEIYDMYDFSINSIEKISELVERNINPFTGMYFVDKEREIVTDIVKIIYSAVNDTDILLEPVKVYFSIFDTYLEIYKTINMTNFATNVANAIFMSLKIESEYFSLKSIKLYYYNFLMRKNLIELRNNPYTNKQSYYATELGENCGLKNVVKKNEKTKYNMITFSAYIQIYLLRLFPEIFNESIKIVLKHAYATMNNLIEPLNFEEQEIITKYRNLNYEDKKLINKTIEMLSKHSVEQKKDSIN